MVSLSALNSGVNSLPLKWASIPTDEVVAPYYRLDANAHGIAGRWVKTVLTKCRWPLIFMKPGLTEEIYRLSRSRNVYVGETDSGIPFFLPSQINDINPDPVKWISESAQADINAMRVRSEQILVTCSGTIGTCTYVRATLKGKAFSNDLVRIGAKESPGYIYAFLKSEAGQILIQSSNYGAVVQHIDPEHIARIRLPNPSPVLKGRIHDLVEKSFRLLDESNKLIADARNLLKAELQLPDFRQLQKSAPFFDKNTEMQNFSVGIGNLNGRLDASYHFPIVDTVIRRVKKNAAEMTTVNDVRISRRVILPGRFKRVYMEKGNGVVFFGGKQIHQLDPNNKKYLSIVQHGIRIKEQLKLKEKMILITCSGSVGKVVLVPNHWEGWAANQHIIRVVPADDKIAGYLFAWLSSEYARPLITRFVYGAVVDEIDDRQVARIPVPLLKDADAQADINGKMLLANRKRAEAYALEQEALRIVDKEVIYARKAN